MKKFTAILVAIVLALFVVSCGGGDDDKDNNKQGGADTGDTGDTDTSDTGDTENPDTGDTGEDDSCKISDDFRTSKFDNFFLAMGAGTLSDNAQTSADLISTTFYDVNYPNVGIEGPAFMYGKLTNGKNAVILDGMDGLYLADNSSAVGVGFEVQTIIPQTWFDMFAQLGYKEGDVIPFAAQTQFSVITTNVKGQSVEYLRQCTVGINKYAAITALQGEEGPEGSFQFCGTPAVGNKMKIGLDAHITTDFAEIQAAFNKDENGDPLEEDDENYIASPDDLCYCMQFVGNNNVEEIECPDSFCEFIDCPDGRECTTSEINPAGYICAKVCGENEAYNEKKDKCECAEGFVQDKETKKCFDPCVDVTCPNADEVCVADAKADNFYKCEKKEEEPDTGDSDTGDSDTGDSDTGDTDTPDTDTPDTDTPNPCDPNPCTEEGAVCAPAEGTPGYTCTVPEPPITEECQDDSDCEEGTCNAEHQCVVGD